MVCFSSLPLVLLILYIHIERACVGVGNVYAKPRGSGTATRPETAVVISQGKEHRL